MKNQSIVILGPTGAGKSSIAVELAKKVGGEVISCDSMQVYRQMDIGTATPTAEDCQGIPHHLINIMPIQEPYDADRFIRYAHSILDDLHKRQVPAIVAGGSGMYAKALIYGLKLPPSDPRVQQAILEELAQSGGEAALQDEVLVTHPGINPDILNNPRRLQRAVEIKRLGGDLKEYYTNTPKKPLPHFLQYIILPPPREFEQKLRQRTKAMLRRGWINETRDLLQAGLETTPTARQALGYPEIGDFLRGKTSSENELLEILITRTRQYARRQRTWFRHQHPGAVHLPLRPGTSVEHITEAILSGMLSASY